MYTLPKVLNLFHMVFIALSFNQLFLVAEAAETDFTCSNPHAFETRFNTFVTGGLVAIGNSNVCADDGATNGAQGNGICDENQSKRNDLNNIIWINKYSVNPAMPWYNDIHNAPDDLLNVSNATLELPEGAKVIWAGLYWHGEVWNFKEGVITNNSGGDYGSEGLALMAQENRVKLRTPIDNVSTYRDIVADEHYWINLKKHNAYSTKGASYGYGYGEDYNYSVEHSYAFKTIDRYEHHYQGFTDVTSLLQEVEAQQGTANGTYWLGNIQASVGFLWWSGVEAAWSLQVAYSLDGGKPRVITMSDGYVGMFNYAGWGIDYAQEQNCSTNAEDTGSYTNSISFEIDNIYTPKKQPFNTDMTIFVTESDPDGDQYDPNLPEALSITKKDGTVYQVDGPEKGNTDAWAYEISDKDGNPIQREPNHWQYPIGMTIKNYHMTDGLDTEQTSTTVTFSTDTDRLIMGVVGFVTDVRMPDLCYDYGYAQDNRYFTEENNGTALPHIKGNLYSNNPINVNLFIKNREESDVIITGMKLNIDSIDTTQASYILGSAKAIKPGESLKQEADVEEEADSYIKGAKIGTIGSQEFFYFYYDLSPELFTIDMPIVGSLDFNTSMTLPDGQVFESPYHLEISNAIPMCVDGNFSYAPLYGTFNIEQKGLEYYNIYTQIANRADNFEIKAYSDPDDDNSWDTPTNVSTAVAIEVIDASAYHETQTSCQEPDSALTPRVWILFDENVSSVNFTAEDIQNAIDNHMVAPDTLSSPEAFYSIARQNAAFRISLGRKESNGTLYQIENNQGLYRVSNIDYAADLGNGAGECAGDVSMSISGACPANMNKEQLTYCMECLYASKTAFICSRDNFAIRPEAFIVSISDDNTSTVITDFANNINQTGDSNTPINLVAGYPYRFDINATSHTSSNAVQGYTQKFTSENPLKVASMIWDPRSISITEASTFCNVPQDRNMTFSLIKGTNINPNPINTWEDRHDALLDIGEYRFDISDEEWTKYDWDTSLIQHHLKTHFNQDNLEDCIRHDVTVTTVPNSDSITEQSGCLISSNYTPNYTDIYIRSYPYSFDLTGLTYGARPQNIQGNTYVYINSLDATPYTGSVVESNGDENMSYNIQGEIKAVGFTNQPMKNFVDQCFADDINMIFNYQFLSQSEPEKLPLQYDLFNSSVPNYIRITADAPDDHIIPQTKENFVQEKEGSLSIDLGYNFNRTFNQPINPVYMNMSDFNVSYAVQPSSLFVDGVNNHTISTKNIIDQNITFIYVAAQPNLFLYDNITDTSVQTPVSIQAYCDLGLTLCQDRGLDTITSGMLSDVESNKNAWWFVANHSSSGEDGTLYLQATNGSVTPSFTPTAGIDNTVTVTNDTPNTSATVDINFTTGTSRWLVYNPFADAIPTPFYRVRFVGSAGWTGQGSTGHIVDDDINKKRHQRVEW